jgi:hypothetical protein
MTKTLQSVLRRSVLAILIIFTTGCSNQPKRRSIPRPTEVAKVRVGVGGRVYVNEGAVTLDELKGKLDKLKQIHGGVWFINESSDRESGRQAQVVKKAIIEAELPMRVR